MIKIRSIKFNFIMNFILTASSFIFPLVTFPYVSRILMAEGTGKIAFAASVVSYFTMVASLGIPTYGIRACARVRENKDLLSKTVHELLIIHTIITTVTFVFLAISIVTVDKFYVEKELMILNGFSMLLNVLGVNWLYSALEQYSYITIRSIIFKVISIVLMFLLVKEKGDYVLYAAITIFAAVGSNIYNFIYLRKFIYLKRYKDYELSKHIKPLLIFFAQAIAISIYTNLDTVMLGFMKGDREVGYYSTAIKLRGMLLALVTSLGSVLLPRFSYYIKEKMFDEYKSLLKIGIEFVLLISIPLTIFFIVFAKETIFLLSGNDFFGAIPAMQIINPTILIVGLSTFFGTLVFTPFCKERYVLYAAIVGAIVDFILNLFFIRVFGSAGAAASTLIAETIIVIILFYFEKELLIKIFKCLSMDFYKILISATFPLIIITFIPLEPFNHIFFYLLSISILYFGIYMIFLLILKESFMHEQVMNLLQTRKKNKN